MTVIQLTGSSIRTLDASTKAEIARLTQPQAKTPSTSIQPNPIDSSGRSQTENQTASNQLKMPA